MVEMAFICAIQPLQADLLSGPTCRFQAKSSKNRLHEFLLNDNHYLHQGIPASIWCLEEQKATEFQRFGFLNLQGSCQVLKKNQLKDLEVWGKLRIRYIYQKNISDFLHGFGIFKHTPCNPWGNKILLLESKLIWWCQSGPHMALVLQNGWWL